MALGIDGSIPGRIVAVSEAAEALDWLVVNIHQAKLGASSIREFGPEQRAFKATVDPFGICNPGHLAEEVVPDGEAQTESARLVASGWSSRWAADDAPASPRP